MKDIKKEADRWWRQSQADFAFLQKIVKFGKADTVCFLSQQTAEKALKAYLFYSSAEFYNQKDAEQAIELAGQVISSRSLTGRFIYR